ncbi:MAG TPA: Panacea domain-containing protein [Thermoanaerobaculia bacterium]|nr:Panacea domain-containing protein [Thermoanaerobaculia bacterium]
MRYSATAQRKFREAVLYVARESEKDPRCGKTKLFKILFYADFAAYRRRRKAITGWTYRKADFGPVPDQASAAIEEIVAEGLCAWAERDCFGYRQKKLLALREPNLDLFSGEEIDLLARTVQDLWSMTAREVSDLSHRFSGWLAAEMGEEIPYSTVFVGEPRALTADEQAWAEGAWDAYLEEKRSA